MTTIMVKRMFSELVIEVKMGPGAAEEIRKGLELGDGEVFLYRNTPSGLGLELIAHPWQVEPCGAVTAYTEKLRESLITIDEACLQVGLRSVGFEKWPQSGMARYGGMLSTIGGPWRIESIGGAAILCPSITCRHWLPTFVNIRPCIVLLNHDAKIQQNGETSGCGL